jgi:multimeric flavodoxin WrbA
MKKILVLDGSLHGRGGNTNGVTEELLKLLNDVEIDYIELKNVTNASVLEDKIRKADGYIVATGTYWQSWGSPMQRFLEQATPWEATDLWMGKPACFVVTMHSLGGAEVLARLQSNFNLFGCLLPPMCSIVYSHVNQMAEENGLSHSLDVWNLEALPATAHNFTAALNGKNNYKAWGVDTTEDTHAVWFKKKSG